MYHVKLQNEIPLPSPAKSDRIVAAHYYAAWKKGAAGIHEGFDDLADIYPDRTPLMGYYDEENPDVCEQLEADIRRNFDKLMSNQARIAARAAGRAVDVSADDFDDAD